MYSYHRNLGPIKCPSLLAQNPHLINKMLAGIFVFFDSTDTVLQCRKPYSQSFRRLWESLVIIRYIHLDSDKISINFVISDSSTTYIQIFTGFSFSACWSMESGFHVEPKTENLKYQKMMKMAARLHKQAGYAGQEQCAEMGTPRYFSRWNYLFTSNITASAQFWQHSALSVEHRLCK